MQQISLFGKDIFLKRDDLINNYLSGNKARKLFYFLDKKFERVVSYGGYQSNAMLSLAALAKMKKAKFTYICKKIPQRVKSQQEGNLYMALEFGMELFEVENKNFEITISNIDNLFPKSLIINQGGAQKEAESGVKALAYEIIDFAKLNNLSTLDILISSGTGATALYLQKNLPKNFSVWTINCVGSKEYLIKQWKMLEDNKENFPKILSLSKKYHFAKPYKEFLEIYHLLLSKNIEIDLIYEPKILLALKENFHLFKNKNVLYIHSGGVIGNATQLRRYEFNQNFV